MIGHLVVAAAAVVALSTGAEAAPVSPPAAATDSAAKAAPKHPEKEFRDHEGNKLRVQFDDAGKVVRAEARDKLDKPLETIPMKMSDMSVCIPRAKGAKPLCQPLTFVSDGAFFKMGTASCTCCNVGGSPFCYGTTCK